MSILIDYRERDLLTHLPPGTPTKNLPVGDAWLSVTSVASGEGEEINPHGVIVERKTVADLEASLLDGRYREQRTRLLAYAAEKQAKAMYIIEGDLDRIGAKKSEQELRKILHRLMLRYGVAVVQTYSTKETAQILQILQKQITEDSQVFKGETLSYTDVQHVTKKANKADPHNFYCSLLQGCPGVSAKMAQTIASQIPTLTQLFETSAEELAKMKVGARAIGPAVGNRLYNLIHGKTTTAEESTA